MMVVGKRSFDLIFGMLIGLIIIGVAVAGMLLIEKNNTFLFAPVVIGMLILCYYGFQYFSIPHNIVYLNEETNELTVFVNNKDSVCFKISSISNMHQSPSGFRRKSTAHIYIVYNDDQTNVFDASKEKEYVLCKYISNADALTKLISDIKEKESTTVLDGFNKL